MNMRVNIRRSARFGLLLGLLAALLAAPGRIAAEQITTVAVVDIDEVFNSFYRDSQQVRELEQLREEFQTEINRALESLESLRDRRLQAQEDGNDRRAEQLSQEITQLERFLEDLTRRRRQQLEQRQETLLSDEFFRQMQSAIQFVAENEGYTVVIRSDFDGLQWWSNQVDISEQVVERLIRVSDR